MKGKWFNTVTILIALFALVISSWQVVGPQAESRVREKISIDARDDILAYNGADLKMYSDNHLTNKFLVDGATGNTTIQGNTAVVGRLEVTGLQIFTGAATFNGGMINTDDIAVNSPANGGNAGVRNNFLGVPRISAVALGAGTNGSTETTAYMDDTPSGEWTAIDADVTVSEDAAIYRVGSKSLKLAFAVTAIDDDGATIDIANDDLEANESIGFWIYSTVALDAGDLDILIDDTDAAPDQSYNVCATTASVWSWCEVDISALAAGTGNVVDKVGFVLKDAAGLAAFSVYVDGMYKWDATDEEALGLNIYQDGVFSVVAVATAAASANTTSILAEGTAFFVHYETGNDFIVWITDQSANSATAWAAHQ